MNILLDSDIIIDFLNKKRLITDLALKSNDKFFISIISWLEVEYGFKKSKISRKTHLFQDFIHNFQVQIISIDQEVAEKYLDIKINLENKNISLADFDLLIGATAITYNLSLITRNIKHFKRIKELKII